MVSCGTPCARHQPLNAVSGDRPERSLTPSGCVYEGHALLEFGQNIVVDHVTSRRKQRHLQEDNVGLRPHLAFKRTTNNEVGGGGRC